MNVAKESIEKMFYEQGRLLAKAIQRESSNMSGTELNSEKDYIPNFLDAIKVMDMFDRPADLKTGFVCRSTAGRIVRLIQKYRVNDHLINGRPAEPEELPAQFSFVWSKNPNDALPFVALSTSPYNIDEVCVDGNTIYASTIDNNVWAPSTSPQFWKAIKQVE